MVPETHETLEGVRVDTSTLAPAERRYLERAFEMFSQNVPWPRFQNYFTGRTSAIWFVDGYIGKGERQGRDILDSAIYQVLSDLNSRLAISQGYMRDGRVSRAQYNTPAESETLLVREPDSPNYIASKPIRPSSAASRVIVALDTQDLVQATAWVASLSGAVGAFKLGLEFLSAHGPQGVREVQAAGADRVFADTKFCDIPNTVAGAVRSICGIDPWLLNVHATAGSAAMRAARKAAEEYAEQTGKPRPLIIAVTVLTSLDQAALAEIGVDGTVEEQVVRLARLSQASGMDGVVASPLEIKAIREACGPGFLIVTPGVRPAGGATHDQARVATPEAAVAAGADYLVIGRAITGASAPLRRLEGVRQAGAVVVPLVIHEDLSFVLQLAERAAVDDPIPVSLERRPQRMLRLPVPATPGLRS